MNTQINKHSLTNTQVKANKYLTDKTFEDNGRKSRLMQHFPL